MADDTDIDKLQLSAEFVQSHRLTALADKQAGAGAYSLHIDVAIALLAELVGLRTEVDQLRGDNERLTRERNLAIAHDTQPYPTAWAYEQACRVMHEAKAERDALQARIDAALVFAAELRQQGDWLRNGHRASDYGWDIDSALQGLPVAALGVDPQKETQQ